MSKIRQIKTDEYTIKSGLLDVGQGHKVYYEQWGNPKAKTPILFFHGGPGDGFKPKHKYRFDPKRHQVIGFDQRGCGNSLPYGKLEHNTTDDLVTDAVKILDKLNIKQVYVYGGSWGSTLSLLFALRYPARVKASIIDGVLTASTSEIDYINKGLSERFFPEVWERFQASVPTKHQDNPAAYHYKILAGSDENDIKKSAKALEELEGPLLRFDWRSYQDIQPDKDPNKQESEDNYVPYKIYAHYMSHACFLKEREILNNAHKIKTPLFIVQGRYDMCCPPITAYQLHQAVPDSKLYITLDSHSPSDPESRTTLKALVDTIFT